MHQFLAVFVLVQIFFTPQASAQEAKLYDGPIFDAHVHYNRTVWDVLSAKDIIAKWDAAGVNRALVSSTPDDGTLTLLDSAPGKVVAFLRPYREFKDLGAWHKMPELVANAEKRLGMGLHTGFGEVHLVRPENVSTPVVRQYLDMVTARGLYIQPHANARVLEALLKIEPRLKVIWAHAGFDEPPASISAMMDTYPNVSADLSFRANDIFDGEEIDPAWRDLLVRHADRFMVGSDTFLNERWQEYEALIANHRSWLSLLPRDIAEKIAFRNAQELFGSGTH